MPHLSLAFLLRNCLLILCVSTGSVMFANAHETERFWSELKPFGPASSRTSLNSGATTPSRYRVLNLNLPDLHRYLYDSVKQHNGSADTPSLEVSLPLPQGGFSQFKLTDSGVMPAGLAKRFPDILSFKGRDSSGRLVSLDLSSKSLRASILSGHDVWLIQRSWGAQNTTPATTEEPSRYWSYSQYDVPAEQSSIDSDEQKPVNPAQSHTTGNELSKTPRGNILYDFRVAITATSGFTRAFGGTVEDGLFAVVNTVNRINRVLEVDVGVHLTLSEQNDKLILTDPADDPTNEDYFWDEANRRLLEQRVGADAYDTGFMFTPINGGASGGIGNTCVPEGDTSIPKKHTAYGHAGHSDPVNAPRFFETAVHEFGHKLGAQHNSDGHQIMSNAVPRHGYFHGLSVDEVLAWLSSRGGQCATRHLNPNPAPWIDRASLPSEGLTIPANTPFRLSAKVLHANPDARLTYAWDGMDGFVFPMPDKDPGYGLLSTTLTPDESNERVFPSLAVVLNKVPESPGDLYPGTTRVLNYILMVRDNQIEDATTARALVQVKVLDTGKAFAVTEPRSVNWKAGGNYPIRWDVAHTAQTPIWCATVSVHLSLDGGHHYLEQPLATRLPNNGSASITLPQVQTLKARLRVSCEGNIFFAVSPMDFVISR